MGGKRGPESLHSVTLSVDGHAYTAHLWRGDDDHWGLLSVEVHGLGSVEVGVEFDSCLASLEAAEQVARDKLRAHAGDTGVAQAGIRAVQT